MEKLVSKWVKNGGILGGHNIGLDSPLRKDEKLEFLFEDFFIICEGKRSILI